MKMASPTSANIDAPLRIRLHRQCGACNHLFLPGDHLVALLCNEKSIRAYSVLTFVPNSQCKLLEHDNIQFCMHHICGFCSKLNEGEESVTVHADCLSMFGQTCSAPDKYQRLWIAGTRIYPWRTVAPLELDPGCCASPELISSAAGLHRTLLPELADIIGGYLQPHHALLRFCSVIRLAKELSRAEMDYAVTYPLCEVLSWSRGASPTLVEQGQAANPRVRLTIDSRGIERIERVSDDSQETTRDLLTNSHAYVVDLVEQLSGVSIGFQLGMSRLQVPTSVNISIWNVPSPQDLPRTTCITFHGKLSSGRFAALDLDPKQCTGLSFFLSIRQIMAIHGHTKRGSRAPQAFQHLNRDHSPGLFWIYIPITANDKVIAIGTREAYIANGGSYSIVLKMKSGTYFIGFPLVKIMGPIDETLHLIQEADDRHLTLIHEVPYNTGISFIAVDKVTRTTSRIIIKRSNFPHYSTHSYASLEGVVNARVLRDKEKGMCRGILLEYEDGTLRALGQCRLGLDTVQCYKHPTKFHYTIVKYSSHIKTHDSRCLQAAFDSESGLFSTHNNSEWKTCPMKGFLQFSFNHFGVAVRYHDAWRPHFDY
ncbi:uncharacterized protein TrAFT101_002191 [Trichoderma asperellum]|nr:hypothetical protein TrAFT101_002191 [Trichoderma asperellum]